MLTRYAALFCFSPNKQRLKHEMRCNDFFSQFHTIPLHLESCYCFLFIVPYIIENLFIEYARAKNQIKVMKANYLSSKRKILFHYSNEMTICKNQRCFSKKIYCPHFIALFFLFFFENFIFGTAQLRTSSGFICNSTGIRLMP